MNTPEPQAAEAADTCQCQDPHIDIAAGWYCFSPTTASCYRLYHWAPYNI